MSPPHHGCGEEDEECEHHGGAAWTVAKITFRAQADEIAHVTQALGWAIDKVGEARVARADKTPNHTRYKEDTHHIARPDMPGERLLDEIGDGEGGHKAPMEDPHEWIPYINCPILRGGCSGILHGLPFLTAAFWVCDRNLGISRAGFVS